MPTKREINVQNAPGSPASEEGMEMGLINSNKEAESNSVDRDSFSEASESAKPEKSKESLRSLDVRRLWELAYPEVEFNCLPSSKHNKHIELFLHFKFSFVAADR